MPVLSVAQHVANSITQPGGWILPVVLLAAAMTGYTWTVKCALDLRAAARATATNLDEERRRRAELNVAMAMGQRSVRS